MLDDGKTPPVADFSADNTAATTLSTVKFTDLSSNLPTSWKWTFDGGTPSTSTEQNPSVTYSTAGTYNVELIATNADGSDTITKNGYITVTDPLPEDKIYNVVAPNQVYPGDTIDVSITYQALGERKLVLFIQDNFPPAWTKHGETTDTVDAGLGTKNIELIISEDIPLLTNSYKIVAFISELDGGWSLEKEFKVVNISAVAAPVAVSSVSISDCPSDDITVGTSHQLTAAVEPNDASNKGVSWESSDETVATVDANGLLTAIAEGTADITVTTDDSEYTDACSITVSKIAATGVSISDCPAADIEVGTSHQLTTVVEPNDATDNSVSWKSSAESIATVDASGLVTAVAKGTADITVTTTDGGHTDVCTITVIKSVTGVLITGCPVDDLEVGATHQLTASVLPDDATDNSVSWSSTKPDVATVDQTGLVTAVGVGSSTIKVTTGDNGFTADCSVTVSSGIINGVLTIAQNDGDVTLYPNPVNETLYIRFAAANDDREINIYDTTGQLLFNKRAKNATEEISIKALNVSSVIIVQVKEHEKITNFRFLTH